MVWCDSVGSTKTRTEVDDQADSGVESPGPRSTWSSSSSEPPPSQSHSQSQSQPVSTVTALADGPTTSRPPATPADCPAVRSVRYSVFFSRLT